MSMTVPSTIPTAPQRATRIFDFQRVPKDPPEQEPSAGITGRGTGNFRRQSLPCFVMVTCCVDLPFWRGGATFHVTVTGYLTRTNGAMEPRRSIEIIQRIGAALEAKFQQHTRRAKDSGRRVSLYCPDEMRPSCSLYIGLHAVYLLIALKIRR
jgi:hypothetical protein